MQTLAKLWIVAVTLSVNYESAKNSTNFVLLLPYRFLESTNRYLRQINNKSTQAGPVGHFDSVSHASCCTLVDPKNTTKFNFEITECTVPEKYFSCKKEYLKISFHGNVRF